MVNAHIKPGDLYKIIEGIPDPEIPVISIGELGLLRDIKYDKNIYRIIISPTYTACPAMEFIEQQIKTLLAKLGIRNVEVDQVYTPAWSTDMMSEAGKKKLRDHGISSPLHSSCVLAKTQHSVFCPRCRSGNTSEISLFGSTACKALYRCNDCKEPFEYFKCH